MKNELVAIERMIHQTFDPFYSGDKFDIDSRTLKAELERIVRHWLYEQAPTPTVDRYMRRYVHIHQVTLTRLANLLYDTTIKKFTEHNCSHADLQVVHPMLPQFLSVIEQLGSLLNSYYFKYLDKEIHLPVLCLFRFKSRIQNAIEDVRTILHTTTLPQEHIENFLEHFHAVLRMQLYQTLPVARVLLLQATAEQFADLPALNLKADECAELLINRLCYINFNSKSAVVACTTLLNFILTSASQHPEQRKIRLQNLYEHFRTMKVNKHLYYEATARSLSNQIAEWVQNLMEIPELLTPDKVLAGGYNTQCSVNEPVEDNSYHNVQLTPSTIYKRHKVQTNASVSILGYFISLGYYIEFYPPKENKMMVVKTFAEVFGTKGKEIDSAASIKNLYNATSDYTLSTLLSAKKMLKKMMNRTDELIKSVQTKTNS